LREGGATVCLAGVSAVLRPAKVKENVALIGEKPGAQPPKRHYNTVLNIVNIILPR